MKPLLLTFAALLSSCATMFNPGPDRIIISSEPSGAEVRLDGELVGTTPATITVGRRAPGALMLQKEGYFPVYSTLTRKDNPATWANLGWILFWPGLIVAIIVDYSEHNFEVAAEPDVFYLVPVDPLNPSTPPPVIPDPEPEPTAPPAKHTPATFPKKAAAGGE